MRRNTNILILLSFLLPLLITSLSFLALQLAPFGDKTLIVSDAEGYYMPFLSYCKSIFKGEHDFLYSFSQNIGGGIAATIWPYLVNPFSWIIAFFDYEGYSLAFSIGVILITSLQGLAMYLLLSDIHGHRGINLIFSTCYALCGFNVAFNIYTPFFFAGPLCLPLMTLGLRKIFACKLPILYTLSITYSLISQIQMGFAVCMASLIFFIAELYIEFPKHKHHIKTLCLRYIFASLAGGLIGAFVWLPELMILRQGRGVFDIVDFAFVSNAPLIDMGARLFTGAGSFGQIINGLPAIFIGMLPVTLAVLFFIDKNNDKRFKYAFIGLLLVYVMGFYIRSFTSVFQGFTHANWFVFRFSFAFSFLLILIAAEEWKNIDLLSKRDVLKCGIIILTFSLLVFSKVYEFVDGGKMILDLLLLLVMGSAFRFYKIHPERAPKHVLVLLFGICTLLQLYLNYFFSSKNVLSFFDKGIGDYQEALLKKQPLIQAVQTTDKSFFRMESEAKLEGSIGNDGLFLDYNGVGYAGHTERGFVSTSLEKLGIDLSNSTWSSYNPGIPAATDALLGIKYIVSDRDLNVEKNYDKRVDLLGNAIYLNPYALPIAMVSDNKISDVSIADEKNVFENLNNIWKGLSGEESSLFLEEKDVEFSNHNPTDIYSISYEQALSEASVDKRGAKANNASEDRSDENSNGSNVIDSNDEDEKKADLRRYSPFIEFKFKAKRTGPVYLYDSAAVVNDVGTAEDVMQYVGFFKKGETISEKLYLNYEITEELMVATIQGLHICYADMDLLQNYSNLIRERPASIQKNSDSYLSGDVIVRNGQRLLFTIPYDKGWKLIADGNEIPLEKTADIFMSAELDPGTYYYEMRFWPIGLSVGIFISLCGMVCLAVSCLINIKFCSNTGEIKSDDSDNSINSCKIATDSLKK